MRSDPSYSTGLGLIRTEELLVSDRYYGLDDQYFTNLIDYGYSKNLGGGSPAMGPRKRPAGCREGHSNQSSPGPGLSLLRERKRRPRES